MPASTPASPASPANPASPARCTGPGPPPADPPPADAPPAEALPVEASTNSVIAAAAAPGSSVTAGCSLTTASAVLMASRILSMPSAITSPASGSAGPKPLLASCLSRRITALRWQAVSPGSRYTVTPCAPRSAQPCNPARSRDPGEKSG